ncbi:hypothetical protein P5V15_012284 [Pogonomyrmex californicus]
MCVCVRDVWMRVYVRTRRQVNAARSSHTDSRAATENRVPGGPSTDSPPDERAFAGTHAWSIAEQANAGFTRSENSGCEMSNFYVLHLAPLFARRCCPSPQAREDTDRTPTCEVYRVL